MGSTRRYYPSRYASRSRTRSFRSSCIRESLEAPVVEEAEHAAEVAYQAQVDGLGDFDAVQYLANYTDLQEAFGTDTDAAIKHYITYGETEGRTDEVQVSPTVPADFNLEQYLINNPDVAEAFSGNPEGATAHYIYYGVDEGRSYAVPVVEVVESEMTVALPAGFDPIQYLENYADLQEAFGDNAQSAIDHWLTYGQYEGRSFMRCS